ncbi:hypothetical protein PENTCL1PPCAC_20094, partial [Pristionchus entomophagus]
MDLASLIQQEHCTEFSLILALSLSTTARSSAIVRAPPPLARFLPVCCPCSRCAAANPWTWIRLVRGHTRAPRRRASRRTASG